MRRGEDYDWGPTETILLGLTLSIIGLWLLTGGW